MSLDIHLNVLMILFKLHPNTQRSIVTTITILFIGLCHSDAFPTLVFLPLVSVLFSVAKIMILDATDQLLDEI